MATAFARQDSPAAICDTSADFFLGTQDYPEAIRLHLQVLRRNANNALAHYHLGFAEGLMGNRTAEITEYQRAAALGLRNWDLFLNLGLAQLESGCLDAATESLRRAVLLGGNHSESHFDLALAYERLGLVGDAEREMLASLRLNPGQPDAWNSLGVIYAEEGKTARAVLVWSELLREAPDYEPARTNLALMGNQSDVGRGGTAAVALLPASAVKAIGDKRKPRLPASEMRPRPAQSSGE